MTEIASLLQILHFVARILSFFFFSVWGWLILSILLVLFLVKQGIAGDGQWRWHVFLLNLSETLTKLLLWFPQIILSITLLFGIALFEKDIQTLYENLKIARETQTLTQALKNLSFEGKILEISVHTTNSAFLLSMKFFTHSPWDNKPILKTNQNLIVNASRVNIDIGVCNFSYSRIAEGSAYNIAFPYRIYTATQAPQNGFSLFTGEKGILSVFDIPEDDLVGISPHEFLTTVSQIVAAITNTTVAKRLGIRTFYGEAIAIDLKESTTYTFVTTGNGGVLLKP